MSVGRLGGWARHCFSGARGDRLEGLDLLREAAGEHVVLEQLAVVRLVHPADRPPRLG